MERHWRENWSMGCFLAVGASWLIDWVSLSIDCADSSQATGCRQANRKKTEHQWGRGRDMVAVERELYQKLGCVPILSGDQLVSWELWASSFAYCVSLGKLLHFSESLFFSSKINPYNTYLKDLLWNLNEIMGFKYTVRCCHMIGAQWACSPFTVTQWVEVGLLMLLPQNSETVFRGDNLSFRLGMNGPCGSLLFHSQCV